VLLRCSSLETKIRNLEEQQQQQQQQPSIPSPPILAKLQQLHTSLISKHVPSPPPPPSSPHDQRISLNAPLNVPIMELSPLRPLVSSTPLMMHPPHHVTSSPIPYIMVSSPIKENKPVDANVFDPHTLSSDTKSAMALEEEPIVLRPQRRSHRN
jgi:hypothetical protein